MKHQITDREKLAALDLQGGRISVTDYLRVLVGSQIIPARTARVVESLSRKVTTQPKTEWQAAIDLQMDNVYLWHCKHKVVEIFMQSASVSEDEAYRILGLVRKTQRFLDARIMKEKKVSERVNLGYWLHSVVRGEMIVDSKGKVWSAEELEDHLRATRGFKGSSPLEDWSYSREGDTVKYLFTKPWYSRAVVEFNPGDEFYELSVRK